MNLLNGGIGRISAVMMVCVMFCFAHLVQAQPVLSAPPFDHSRTGFLLKDVHFTLKCEQCHIDGIFKNTPKACSGCHSTGTRVAATPQPKNHVPTPSDCNACHISAANFLVKSYNHAGVAGACTNCHDGRYTGVVGKPATHFPTTQPCEYCHTNTSTFLSWRMNHAGMTSNCSSCHGGPVGRTYPGVTSFNQANHVPLQSPTQDCASCHKDLSTFLGVRYDHSGVVAGSCGNCHKGQYPNVTAINAATHLGGIPAAACDTCHIGYASFQGALFSHSSTTAACSTCHTGRYPSITSINTAKHIPLPSGTTCDSCHSSAGSAPTFLGVTFHAIPPWNGPTPPAGMTCTTCHSGAYVSQNAIGKGATHVPTTADCVTCHTSSYTTFQGATFSHSGLPAGTCGTCHLGQYGGVTSINSAKHIPQSSGNACDACHTNAKTGLPGSATPTFLNVVYHQTTQGSHPTGSCTTCHSGAYIAQGALAKNLGHVTTAADCGACHTAANTSGYTSFLGASFSHTPGTYAAFPPSGTTATPRCDSCHNGATATGKLPTHVATTGDCNSSSCHTNATTGCPNCLTFYGVQYDHTNATTGIAAYTTFPAAGSTPSPRCDSCHGSTAIGKSSGHIPTTADCMTCHTPANTGCGASGLCSTFLGATFSHVGIAAGTCGTCHRGQYASVESINTAVHIPQTSGNACDACHTNAKTGLPNSTTPTFLNVLFHQTALGNPPAATCTSCHSGAYISQNALPKNTGHQVTTEDCIKCHNASNTLGYTTFSGASFSHTPGTYASFPSAAPATPACSSCHGVSATPKNPGHISTVSDCIACHTNASTGCPNCSTFLGAAAAGPHTIASGAYNGTCVSCHNGSTAVGLSSNPNHIPINGIDCKQCHPAFDGAGSVDFSSAAVAGGGMVGTLTRYTMKHTGLTGRCDSCHGASTYTSQGIYGALPKVVNHIPTTITGSLDCTTCHTTLTAANITVVAGAADWKPEVMNHNGAQGGGPVYCVDCHLKGLTYLGSMDKKSHEGTSRSKDCSSSGCHKPKGSRGAAYSRWD
ncbi:MAG: hypothetical protein WAW02_10745 [Sideroxyarcus sp.]